MDISWKKKKKKTNNLYYIELDTKAVSRGCRGTATTAYNIIIVLVNYTVYDTVKMKTYKLCMVYGKVIPIPVYYTVYFQQNNLIYY